MCMCKWEFTANTFCWILEVDTEFYMQLIMELKISILVVSLEFDFLLLSTHYMFWIFLGIFSGQIFLGSCKDWFESQVWVANSPQYECSKGFSRCWIHKCSQKLILNNKISWFNQKHFVRFHPKTPKKYNS